VSKIVKLLGASSVAFGLAWCGLAAFFWSEPGYRAVQGDWRGWYAIPALVAWAVWVVPYVVTAGATPARKRLRNALAVPTVMACVMGLAVTGVVFRVRFELGRPALEHLIVDPPGSTGDVRHVDGRVGLYYVTSVVPFPYGRAQTNHMVGSLSYSPGTSERPVTAVPVESCDRIRGDWWHCTWNWSARLR
jgi:hypothetical protein